MIAMHIFNELHMYASMRLIFACVCVYTKSVFTCWWLKLVSHFSLIVFFSVVLDSVLVLCDSVYMDFAL